MRIHNAAPNFRICGRQIRRKAVQMTGHPTGSQKAGISPAGTPSGEESDIPVEYIIWKYSMIQHILTNSKAILFDCHGMNGINYPYNGPKLLHNKIAYWLPKILNTGLLYLAIITLLILCDINGFIFYTNPTTKFFSRSIVLLCLLSIVMTLICQTSVQIRYIVPLSLIHI